MEFPVSLTSIIFVILLIVPGLLIKRFYFSGDFTTEFGFGDFADRLISSIFLGLIVQISSFILLGKIYGFTYESVREPVTKLYDSLTKSEFKNISSEYLGFALLYIGTNIGLAIAIGSVTHALVRTMKWDVKYRILRFNNHWNYYFKGDILHSKKFKTLNRGKILETQIDVIMDIEHEGKKKMVSGFLSDYTLSKTGDLEYMYLTNASRYSTSSKEFKPIIGDCFIVPYNKVIDLNVTYIFKNKDVTKLKELLNVIFGALLILGTLISIIYPWFLKLGFVKTLIIIILSTITSSFGLIILDAIVNIIIGIRNNDINQNSKALKGWSLFVVILMFLFLCLVISSMTTGLTFTDIIYLLLKKVNR